MSGTSGSSCFDSSADQAFLYEDMLPCTRWDGPRAGKALQYKVQVYNCYLLIDI